jgi:chemotaxis protein methyltransferase CheR
LRDLIHERTGVYFDQNNLELMKGKVTDLMAELGLDSPFDYYYLLKYEEGSGGEWSKLLDAISVRETYFWREIDQIHTLANVLMPCLASRVTSPLKIWSAACATGDEPITIAMALDQAGWFNRIPIEICASDMSPTAINSAKRGVYKARSFRRLPAELRDRYFTRVSDGWEIDPSIRTRITWRNANMTNRAEIESLAHSHVIFCRNVFIYFSEQTIRTVVQTFEQCMASPGYLFVGAAESLLRVTNRFRLQQIEGAFVYVRE